MRPDAITVKLICRDMPADDDLFLGIQEGKEVIRLTPASQKEVVFEARFRLGARKDGSPNFLGPFAQGPAAQRFLYVNWGRRQLDGSFDYFSRAKIHLSHMTWKDIETAAKKKSPPTAELRMVDDRGNPICATIRPENITWRL